MLPIVPHRTYAALAADVYLSLGGQSGGAKVPAGWIKALDSAADMDVAGFGAALYVCAEINAAVVSFRGTTNVENMWSDVYLFNIEVPLHLHLALAFVQMARAHLRAKMVLSFTGHSLGACVAACCAYVENAPAVVFDSPGEQPLLVKLGFSDFSPARCGGIVSYVAEPNIINTLHPHVGVMIQLPTQTAISSSGQGPNPLDELPLVARLTIRTLLPKQASVFLRQQAAFVDRQFQSHRMAVFLTLFQDGEPAQQSLVLDWPSGAFQCNTFETCAKLLQSPGLSPAVRVALEIALAGVWKVRPRHPHSPICPLTADAATLAALQAALETPWMLTCDVAEVSAVLAAVREATASHSGGQYELSPALPTRTQQFTAFELAALARHLKLQLSAAEGEPESHLQSQPSRSILSWLQSCFSTRRAAASAKKNISAKL